MMVSGIVALCLHIEAFNFPLLVEVGGPLCKIFVDDHVSELIQSQIWHFVLITIEPVHHVWSHDVVECPIVGCREVLHTLTNHVSIKLLEETNKSDVSWWDETFQFSIINIPERLILCWIQPCVIAVESK